MRLHLGLREARDDAGRDGVAADRHDDRNRSSRLLGRVRPRCPVGHDDIDVETNKLGHQIREPIVFTLRPPELYDNVPALDVTEIAQARSQGLNRFSGPSGCRGTQKSDPRHLAGLLRPRRDRPRSRRAADQRDEPAAPSFDHLVGARREGTAALRGPMP